MTAILAGLFAVTAVPVRAQIYTPVYDFGAVDSSQNGPAGQLALGRDGNYYGTMNPNTSQIFQITPEGVETLLWSAPQTPPTDVCDSGLTLGADGLLYGTCMNWQDNDATSGAIFKFDPSQGPNGFTLLYTFPSFFQNFSSNPSPLTLGADGNFYGTTNPGQGASQYGTFFKVTPTGAVTTLYTFQGPPDGAHPAGPLTLGADGNFYGTTLEGGMFSSGTVFRITPNGKEKILYSFDGTTGRYPRAGVTQGKDGNFYGTVTQGGATYDYGTIFKLTPAGQISVLHNFDFVNDLVAFPQFPLTLGSDGNFYGPSEACYNGNCGGSDSLFEITPSSVFTSLYSGFSNPCSDSSETGCYVSSPMALNPSGVFYGLTSQGGANSQYPRIGRGVFYSFSTGLSPFVIPQTPAGKVGNSITILGHGFNSATAVAFNGTSASFTVLSDTALTATIPAGATKGYIKVTESSGVLKSITKFTPKP